MVTLKTLYRYLQGVGLVLVLHSLRSRAISTVIPTSLSCPPSSAVSTSSWTCLSSDTRWRQSHNLSRARTSYTTVACSPLIDAKPVDMTTVYTTMRKCKDMSAEPGQHHSFQTIDQQLYAFAQQLKWAFPDELPEVEICPVTNIPILQSFTPDLTDLSSECLKRTRK